MNNDEDQWGGKPYYPISQFYKNRFGEKTWKIPVSFAATCPNREGIRGMKTCNFCDVWGSAAYPEHRDLDLKNQIDTTIEIVRKKYKANKYLVYFQAYTNTFEKTEKLRSAFETAVQHKDVVGFVIGTRPDCISGAVLELWKEYSKKYFVSIELGVQSFNEDHLIWMRRGHTAQKSVDAIHKIKKHCPDIDLGIHLMFGSPGETEEEIIDWAKKINQLPVDNVKLHNIHVLKNTPLEKDFNKGEYIPLSRKQYARRVSLFLENLKPEISVHRLTAVASRHDELVAPDWVANKMESYQYVLSYLKNNSIRQGMSTL